MRRISLCTLLIALVVASVAAAAAAGPQSPNQTDNDDRVPLSLLVQAAMQQGRECVNRGEFKSAVRILEAQLPKINGHAGYLALLEDAYRGHVKELRAQGQTALAQRYLERLAILDPGVMLTSAVRPALGQGDTGTRGHGDKETTKQGVKETGADAAPLRRSVEPTVQAGDMEFLARQYYEAAKFYQEAFQVDPELSQVTKERWAYCKLHWVTQQMNQPAADGPNWSMLENEVRAALRLAPRLEHGQKLLKSIQERGKASTSRVLPAVQHQAQKQDGWSVAASANFRVFHLDAELGEKILHVAEETRATIAMKWLGEKSLPPWANRCDIYLYPTAEAYCRATGVPTDSPGHSSVGAERHDASRIHSRRIDLHADEPNMLRAVLPHEATHVVLAGHLGAKALPRWADEGIAILSEPPDRIQRHLRDLPRAYEEGRIFSVGQLMELDDYPGHQFMHTFYGQSAALVQFLVETRGSRAVVEFLRSAQREGYQAALHRHFDIHDYSELEQRWLASVMASNQK